MSGLINENFDRNTIQVIHIEAHENGGFTLQHKHKDFYGETYLPKSKPGLLSAVRNLIYGYLPSSEDLRLPEGGKPTAPDFCRAKPLD